MALNPSKTLQENATTTRVRYAAAAAIEVVRQPFQVLTTTRVRYAAAAAIEVVRQPFQVLTTTLLSLLLPLSYLLLARLATAGYLFSVSENQPTTSFLNSYLLYTKNPTILHLIVSITSVAALSNALTEKTTSLRLSPEPLTRQHVYVAWLFLVVLQVCVGVGIEGSIAVGIEGSSFGQEDNFLCRLVFFFGLHETMLFWWRTVVKPVVDDTIFGRWREEGRLEKVMVGLSYGGLWWWRLREEVEALVVVPEVKREMMMGIGVVDFVGWWLYYVTVTIGMVRMVKGLFSTVLILTRRREERVSRPNDEKV